MVNSNFVLSAQRGGRPAQKMKISEEQESKTSFLLKPIWLYSAVGSINAHLFSQILIWKRRSPQSHIFLINSHAQWQIFYMRHKFSLFAILSRHIKDV